MHTVSILYTPLHVTYGEYLQYARNEIFVDGSLTTFEDVILVDCSLTTFEEPVSHLVCTYIYVTLIH